MSKRHHRSAWVFLVAVAFCVIVLDAQMVTAKTNPSQFKLERRSCQEDPHDTVAFDNSAAGDKLYRYVYSIMIQNGIFVPVCTVGYDGKRIVLRLGNEFLETKVGELKFKKYVP